MGKAGPSGPASLPIRISRSAGSEEPAGQIPFPECGAPFSPKPSGKSRDPPLQAGGRHGIFPSGLCPERSRPGPRPGSEEAPAQGKHGPFRIFPGCGSSPQPSILPVLPPGRITEPRPVQPGCCRSAVSPASASESLLRREGVLSPPDPALSRSPHGPACLPGRPSHSPR